MDHRKFLGRREELTLPYFGGPSVYGGGRRLRLETRPERGFWRFEIQGRQARALERVSMPELGTLPKITGHHASGYLFASGREVYPLEFLEEGPPAELASCTARVAEGGFVLFVSTDFEFEAEDGARRALQDEAPLGELSGVGASLRAAYTFALASRLSRSLAIPVTPRELTGQALAIAEGGREAAIVVLRALQERRRLESLDRAARPAVIGRPDPRRAERSRPDPLERVVAALDAAGAVLLEARVTSGGIEVTWRFLEQRVISLVEPDGLRVIDAGFCLDGEDGLVTLESLPSVLREALDGFQLNITRR
jgi:hypothetical protein